VTDSIVVGFDDTEHSFRAVECAIREARARKVPLRLLNVYRWIPPTSFGLPPGLAAEEAMRDASESVVAEAAERIRAEHPDLVVEAVSASGDPAGTLADASRRAAMLVVGGRGRGGFVGQLLGSVALRVLGYTECPVMVVRGDPAQDTGRIMVGVDLDDPHGSSDILEFAFSEAVLRGAHVYVIHVWADPAGFYLIRGAYLPEMFTAISANRRKALDSLIEPWTRKYPDVTVSCQAFPGSPSQRLVDSTRLVDALVIGGRVRTEGHAGMRVGALAHTVLHHAHCPVIIVPEH
jgi:nucleotide-binding universal stress UspA family protein